MKKFVLFAIIVGIGCLVACRSSQSTQPITPATEVTYNGQVRSIMNNYCVTCHAGEDPASGFALTSYEEVRKQAEKGELLFRINSRKYPMPKGGLMPKNQRLLLQAWADQGFKKGPETPTEVETTPEYTFTPPALEPVDISAQGLAFFEQMKGHWVGNMNIMGTKMEWFAFDYRPISPAHIHGIYEGGTMGNIMTSFFIANYKGTRTIMARNGGLLNGIYRMSYFVLDKVETGPNRSYYRLVDAYGGKDIMWMELEFTGDQLRFNSYTSRFGSMGRPKKHMQFAGTKKHLELADAAAKTMNYPQDQVEHDFSQGMPMPSWGPEYPVVTSASYVYEEGQRDLPSLGQLAGDPIGVEQMPHLASLKVNIGQSGHTANRKLIIYLSREALTDEEGKAIMENGYPKQSLFDGILAFPELASNTRQFTFHYLHPGDYYITVVADSNGDHYLSEGDATSPSRKITIGPKVNKLVMVNDVLTRK